MSSTGIAMLAVAEFFMHPTATEITFWLCVGVVGYVYVGYPVLLWTLSWAFGRDRSPTVDGGWPNVSVIIAAHNEESVIAERIENLLHQDYPAGKLEVLIASDGSTDRTCDIVRRFVGNGVILLDYPNNRGKVAVLNDAVGQARGEILVLSDANTMLDRQATRRLARWFSQPDVGVVCGRLDLVDSPDGNNADGMYWRYETFLKMREARLNALLGANGAIYAIRRSLFPPLPPRVAVDDFVVPLLVRLRSESVLIYDPEAVAREETPDQLSAEFGRRSRIGAGGFQSLGLLWPLLNPRHGYIALAFFSHKVLRWLVPFFLLGALASNLVLIREPLYGAIAIAQLLFYAIPAAGYFWPQLTAGSRLLRLPTMFIAMNVALLAGFFRWVRREQSGTWARTERTRGGTSGPQAGRP